MNWIPFRKSVAKKVNHVIDSEFHDQIEKLDRGENNSRKMYKDMKRYLEDNSNIIKVENRLGEDFVSVSSNINNEDELSGMAKHIRDAFGKQTELNVTLNENLQKLFIEPMKRFSVNYSSVVNAVKRRDQSLQDYNKYLLRKEKLKEKESQIQSGKFDANERYLYLARTDFERRNDKLLEELPKFYECRLTYFQPCFEGLIKSQHDYFKQSRDLFEKLGNAVDCPLEQRTDEDYRTEMFNRLSEIKSLSIVAEK